MPGLTVKDLPTWIANWVEEKAALLKPNTIRVCDGTQEEFDELCELQIAAGSLIRLNQEKLPGCYLARSDPSDVARVESCTYICTEKECDAGPTNHWKDPKEMRTLLEDLMNGAMRGRTMYVIPFSMGPVGSPFSRIGIEISDSPYVVINMRIMAHMGKSVIDFLHKTPSYDFVVHGIHTVGKPLNDGEADVPWPCNSTKYIVHFPETQSIYSYGSGYGGNALLGKKCFALRIGSFLGRKEGWYAEHMLIMGVTNPEGVKKYICAAFPSACGKTNLAMIRPKLPGWKFETVGDDIAWIRPGPDGRLYAINPENGFFGVAPGTSWKANPVAMETILKNTIYTNVALAPDGDVWWEGKTDVPPEGLIDWHGNPWDPNTSKGPSSHPNARFTAPLTQCPIVDDAWDSPQGVPISAILFGGRRRRNVPLVVESFDWAHGVYLGASISSEQTAAAEGTIGSLRHDPFAMLPFCGYNMGDYFAHWLNAPNLAKGKLPRIYQVNWFRKGNDGNYLWPGFGDNAHVLKWIFERDEGTVSAEETPIGRIPLFKEFSFPEGFDTDNFAQMFAIDKKSWLEEMEDSKLYFSRFGDRLPAELKRQLEEQEKRLQ